MAAGPEGRFRVFPTRSDRQRFVTDADACGSCLGGTCCQSEDAIYLTALDVLRLATYLDLSPPEFFRRFTQERFAEGPLEPYRRVTIDDPESSVVTYLRRRSNRSFSPCIFLKYVREPDGLPRRVCGVHPARPLACREYYHHHCKTRATGELAALQAHTFEMIRNGAITLDMAETQRTRLAPLLTAEAPMSAWLEYAVWTEARRALQPDAANEDGAGSYPIDEYQDPMPEKINRLLSKPQVRLEERYGWVPHGEQLQPFTHGSAFAASADCRRIMRLVAEPPSHGLFEDGDYPFFAANRLTIAGMRPPTQFALLSTAQRRSLLRTIRDTAIFPSDRNPSVRATTTHEIWRASLAAADALVTFAGYVAALGQVLETEPRGTFEWEILNVMHQLAATRHPLVRRHPGLGQVRAWARSQLSLDARMRRHLQGAGPFQRVPPATVRRLLDSQLADGTWARDPLVRDIPDSQADYLRAWFHTTASGLLSMLAADPRRS